MFNKADLETIRGFCKDEDSFQQMLHWMAEREGQRQNTAFNPETRLQTIFQNFPDAILLTEAKPGGCILDVNTAFERLTGFAAEKVIGLPGETLWGKPENRRSYVEELQAHGHVENLETLYKRKDNSHSLALVSAALVTIEGKECSLVIARDISEYATAREELQKSEERYRRIVEHQTEAICRYTPDLYYSFANKAYCDAFGSTPDEITGTSVLALIPPEHRHRVSALVQTIIETGKGQYQTQETLHKDGTWRWYEWMSSPIFDEQGKVVEIQAVGRDITDLKNAEDELKLLLKALPHTTVMIFDHMLNCRTALGRGVQPIGMTVEELENAPLADHFFQDSSQAAQFKQQLFSVLEGHELTRDYQRGDYIFAMRAYPLMREGRSATGILILEDVTETRKEEQRRINYEIEKQRVQVITQFIEEAKHEFRTPLSIIESSLYLASRVKEEEKRDAAFRKARRQTERILQLVDDLVTMARLDSSDLVDYDLINLNYAIRLLAEETQQRCLDKTIDLDLMLAADMPAIYGDYMELMQALKELIDNAIHFTPGGGNIEIATSFDAETVYVSIKDSGVGILPEEIERIFDRFYRADSAHTTAGFGLGLSIARSIVERHDGKIIVSSEPGQGASFDVRFSRITAPEQPIIHAY